MSQFENIFQDMVTKPYNIIDNGIELGGKMKIALHTFLSKQYFDASKNAHEQVFPYNADTDYRFVEKLLANDFMTVASAMSQDTLAYHGVSVLEDILSGKTGQIHNGSVMYLHQDDVKISPKSGVIYHGVTICLKTTEETAKWFDGILSRNEPLRLLKKHLLEDEFYVCVPFIIQSFHKALLDEPFTGTVDDVWGDYQTQYKNFVHIGSPCNSLLVGREFDRPISIMLDVASVLNDHWANNHEVLKEYYEQFKQQIIKETQTLGEDVIKSMFVLDYEMLMDSDPFTQLTYLTNLGFNYMTDVRFLKELKASEELIDLVNEEKVRQTHEDIMSGRA